MTDYKTMPILVVDDDEADVFLVKDELEAAGFENVHDTQLGSDALALLGLDDTASPSQADLDDSATSFALVVLVLGACVIVLAVRHGAHWLNSNALILALVLLLQLGLGAAAWVTRFGWPDSHYVAVQGAPLQVAIRTTHAVTGQLLLLASVTLAIRILRLDWLTRRELIAEVVVEGGLA